MDSNISGGLLWQGYLSTHLYLPVRNYGRTNKYGEVVKCHLIEYRLDRAAHSTLNINESFLTPIKSCVFTNNGPEVFLCFIQTMSAVALRVCKEHAFDKCIILNEPSNSRTGDEILIHPRYFEIAPSNFTFKYNPYGQTHKNHYEISDNLLRDGNSIGEGQYTPGGA